MIRLIVAVCRLLLRLYPAAFRARHADALLSTVEFSMRDAVARQGGPRAVFHGIRMVLDVAWGVAVERLRRRREWRTGEGRPMGPGQLLEEARLATRSLWRSPAHTFVATLTLALGIGACVALFSVMNAVVLRPLPFDDPGELAHLWTKNETQGTDRYVVSPNDVHDWRERSAAFEALAGYYRTQYALTDEGAEPERVRGYMTTGNFFETLGVRAIAGRTFTAGDGQPGSEPVVVLSEAYWRSRFGADPAIVGRTIQLEGRGLEVVGVVSTAQTFPNDAQLWTQITFPLTVQGRGARWLSVVGRLRDGVELSAGRAEMERIAADLGREFPENAGWGVTVLDLRTALLGDARMALILLFGAATVVLIVACANVAGMTLVRAQERVREMAVRASLGATRLRLGAQLLMESVVLSAGGAALGLALAWISLSALPSFAVGSMPRIVGVGLDGAAALVATACIALTALVLGVAPAFQLGRVDPAPILSESPRGGTSGRAHARLRSTFVVAQVAAAVILVTGGVQLARSFDRLLAIDPGFDATDVITIELDLQAGYPDFAAAGRFYQELESRVAALDGIDAVGLTSSIPLGNANDYFQAVQLPDAPVPPEESPRAYLRQVSAGWLETMRVPLLGGRAFTDFDREGSAAVAIVNETFARRYFPGTDPVGRTIGGLAYQMGPLGIIPAEEAEIVGVVADIRYDDLREPPAASVYFPLAQAPFRRMILTLRTRWSPQEAARSVRGILAEMDPRLPISDVATLNSRLDDELAPDRRNLLLVSSFGAVALLLAGLGIFGIVSWSARQRIPEFGIRMALGASPRDILRMVLRHALRLILLGIAIGVVATLPAMRLLASQLYGIDALDPLALAVMAAVLGLTGLIAGAIPALRATRMDPRRALGA